MIKECLNLLMLNNFGENTMRPTVLNLLENFDEDQLVYLLRDGVKISKDLTLYFNIGMGFRCMNDNTHIIGTKPICGVIERNLNHKYIDLNNQINS